MMMDFNHNIGGYMINKVYLEEQDVVDMMVEFLKDYQLNNKSVSINNLKDYANQIAKVDNKEIEDLVSELAQGVLDALTEDCYLSASGNEYNFIKWIDDDAEVIIDYEREQGGEQGK